MSSNGLIFARVIGFGMNADLELKIMFTWTVQAGISSGNANAVIPITPYSEQRRAIIRQKIADAVIAEDYRLADVTGRDVLLLDITGVDQVATGLNVYKEEKNQGGKLQYEKYYTSIDGYGNFTDLAIEYLYSWTGNTLIQKTTNIYDENEILIETVIEDYSTVSSSVFHIQRSIS